MESNSRLTAGLGALIFILLAAEGLTILSIRGLLGAHVFIGMMLIPPVVAKMASTAWRFNRYYRGDPAYRRKGPPPIVLRLLGPAVIALTILVLASGVALVVVPSSLMQQALFVHKASFVLWFGGMTLHVFGHLRDTAQLAPLDWARRTRANVRGWRTRLSVLAITVLVGVGLGMATWGSAAHYHFGFGH